MAKVAGAGDDGGTQDNPPVHSKGNRHGIPWHPAPVSRPGTVAPSPPQPRSEGKDVSARAGDVVTRHFSPSDLGSAMAEGKSHGHSHNKSHTDTITHGAGPGGPAALERKSYGK